MKKFVIATLLLGSATLAQAGSPKLINSDGSELSALCITATHTTLLDAAARHRIPSAGLRDISCNGVALTQFARQYRDTEYRETSAAAIASLAPAGYLLRKKDESPLTALCVAAAVSEQEYVKVRETHFGDEAEADIEAEVLCNGVPLRSFVRKFRESDVRLVTQR